MKKIFVFVVVFLNFSQLSISQEIWFDAGIKWAWGPTLLINKNAMNDAHLNQKINTGFGYGAKAALNFGYIHGITFDFLFNNGHQSYVNTNQNNEKLDINWKSKDLYVLYRLYRTINYFEIGPKFTWVSSFENNSVETTDYYVDKYPSAVLGFGWYVFGNKAFTGTLGLRFEYAFNDIINPDGKESGYPTAPFKLTEKSYSPTNPLIAQISFEINWGLGYFAKTACGGRKHFFSF